MLVKTSEPAQSEAKVTKRQRIFTETIDYPAPQLQGLAIRCPRASQVPGIPQNITDPVQAH